jgi:hypothetical protein
MIKYEKSEWNEVEQGIKFNKINNSLTSNLLKYQRNTSNLPLNY